MTTRAHDVFQSIPVSPHETEPTQAEIDGVAAVFEEIADDPVARSSAYIVAKKLKRVFQK